MNFNVGYACINWTIRHENIEKDSSPLMRKEIIKQISKFGKVTIVSKVAKESIKGITEDWGCSIDLESEPTFDILLVNASSELFLNHNKNFLRLMRIIFKAKNFYIYFDDTEQVIPEKYANKIGYTFFSKNLRKIFSNATKIEVFRKVKKVPDFVEIGFIPHYRPNEYENVVDKTVFFGYLGSRWKERSEIIDSLFLGLPQRFKPSIGYGKGWETHKNREDINLLGWVDQSWYGNCISTLTVHRGKSIRFGWTPSKLPGETFHRNVIVIFEKKTFDSFESVFKHLSEFDISPFIVSTKEELIKVLEKIEEMTIDERIKYCRKWVNFMHKYINSDTLYFQILENVKI